MKKHLEFAEQVFTVLSLLHYTAGPLSVILSGGANQESLTMKAEADNSLIWLLFLFNYGVSFFLLVARWKKTIYLCSKDRFIWLLVGIAAVSILWSFSPDLTLRRGIALVGSTFFGFYLATRYSLKELLQLLGWAFGIAVVLSFLFGILLPKYGIMGGIHAGKWRGIYPHKNTLGKTMVPSSIVFLLLAMDSKTHRLILWGGFIFSIVLLLLSTSKTSLVNLISLLATIPIYRMFQWRYEIMIPALIGITTLGGSLSILLMSNSNTLLSALGKDATLTGRTDLWPAVLDKIWQHPWLGYGYSGFWSSDWSGESAYIWYATGWTPPNSHNGFLDLWLDLGLLGVSIFVMGFGKTLVRGLVWVRLSRMSSDLFPLVYITYIILANLAENTLLVQNDIFWVLYVTVSLSVLLPPEKTQKGITLTLPEKVM